MLELQNIHVSFENKPNVLDGVSFQLSAGETLAVLGPSGCGKSTLLSVIAGLLTPESGAVLWDGADLSDTPTHQRGFGLMFQDYALFPHMRVRANIAFGLKMQKLSQDEIDQRVTETLELVGLPGFEGRDVNNLSGGEQQRVALARALAPKPRLLMLDEPLGSLDRALRQRLLEDLRQIIKSTRQTTIYVTHDQEEAYALADRVVVMRAGQVAQIGAPQEIYRQPASQFVARFIGLNNFLPGQAAGGVLSTPLGEFPVNEKFTGVVTALLRPDEVRLGAGDYMMTGAVVDRAFYGEFSQVTIRVGEYDLSFSLPSGTLPEVGEQVRFSFEPETALQIFEETEGTL